MHGGKKWVNEETPDMDSLAASPRLQDVDDDGDLDLLIGNISGNVIQIINEGNAKTPVFGEQKTHLQADGKNLNVANNDSGPTTADWDGDGLWDLIVGGGDGSVVFFKNTGTTKAAQFAAGITLVDACGERSLTRNEVPKRSNSRVKPHVYDWNDDGLLDLLVGDFASLADKAPSLELTPEQTEKMTTLEAQSQTLYLKMGKLFEKQRSNALDETDKKELATLQENNKKIQNELRPLIPLSNYIGGVWVYLQVKKK